MVRTLQKGVGERSPLWLCVRTLSGHVGGPLYGHAGGPLSGEASAEGASVARARSGLLPRPPLSSSLKSLLLLAKILFFFTFSVSWLTNNPYS